tara:strand:+ start:4710 stop:5909 length:1200 start_codon:yes stop_codon:yes gene_type:complete
MLLAVIAIVSLIIFFSYFVKINLRFPSKYDNLKKKQKVEEEIEPESASIAVYKQMRYQFLNFAKFFLLVKRPYGLQPDVDLEMGETGNINGKARGEQGAGNPEGCRHVCSSDPTCNAWKYDSIDGKCKKYKIDDRGDVTINDDGSDQIGYVFRAKDKWAVEDLSNLPADKESFKAIADMVLKLNCKMPELRKRASRVISSPNVRYCFEKELTTDGLTQEYILARDEAVKSLETSMQFFIFSGDSGDFQHKEEFSLLMAKVYTKMSDKINLFEDNAHLSSAIDVASSELMEFYQFYNLVKTYFAHNLDKNQNSVITRDELLEVYKDMMLSGENLDGEIFDDGDLMFNEDTCFSLDSVREMVDKFFEKFDMNRDGVISLHEMLSSRDIPKPKYEMPKCDQK